MVGVYVSAFFSSAFGLAIIILSFYSGRNSDVEQKIVYELTLLKNEYPSQSWNTWYTLTRALRKHLSTNSTHLMLILLVTPPCGRSTATSMASHLAKGIQRLYGIDGDYRQNIIVGEDYFSLTSGPEFNADVRLALEGNTAVVVQDIQDVNSNVALMFLALYDELMSKYSNSILVMTLSTQRYAQVSASTAKDIAKQYVQDAWSGSLHEDILLTLTKRITENCVLVTAETSVTGKHKKLQTLNSKTKEQKFTLPSSKHHQVINTKEVKKSKGVKIPPLESTKEHPKTKSDNKIDMEEMGEIFA